MNANQVRVEGGFPIPYGVELLKTISPIGCLDSTNIMLFRSMAVIHYFEGAVIENVKMVAKIQALE